MSIPDKDGNTLLHYMAADGNIHVIKTIIKENDADINAQNKRGQTPLDVAYDKEQLEAALLLIKNGPKISETNNE